MFDLREPGCSCVTFTDSIRFQLEGIDPPLCRVHQRAEVAERDAAKVRAEAERRAALLGAVVGSLRPPPECSCPSTVDQVRASLEGLELVECPAHPASTPTQAPSIALNDDASLAQVIAGAFGAPVTVNNDGWLPPAA